MDLLESLKSLLPVYTTVLPFSKKEVSFTPFKVKDAKNLAIVLQEENKVFSLKALYEILNNSTRGVNIDELCLADAEYLFLMIRSKSIEEKLNLIVNGTPKQINLGEIQWRNTISSKEIQVSSELTLLIETPLLKDLLHLKDLSKKEVLISSIKKVTAKKEVYDVSKFVSAEIKEFLDNLPLWVLTEIEKTTHPELYIVLSDKDKESEVSGILTFFTFP